MPREKIFPLTPEVKQYAMVPLFPSSLRKSIMFMEILASAARLRRGNIRLEMPVETNSGSS